MHRKSFQSKFKMKISLKVLHPFLLHLILTCHVKIYVERSFYCTSYCFCKQDAQVKWSTIITRCTFYTLKFDSFTSCVSLLPSSGTVPLVLLTSSWPDGSSLWRCAVVCVVGWSAPSQLHNTGPAWCSQSSELWLTTRHPSQSLLHCHHPHRH